MSGEARSVRAGQVVCAAGAAGLMEGLRASPSYSQPEPPAPRWFQLRVTEMARLADQLSA